MTKTPYARKLDNTGRLIIPSQLRKELSIQDGETYDFYIHEFDGETYLCIKCDVQDLEVKRAKELLEKHGYKIFKETD